MAQTIKIKRSTTNGSSSDSFNTPASLANGELAYLNNATHKKLYIGRPGGGTGDIDVIGGKDFTDKADAALARTGGAMTGAITTNSTFDGRDVATDGTKLDGIEAGADVTDATNVAAAGALMLTGGTLTGDISFGDSLKIKMGAQAGGDLNIYHDGTNSVIQDRGTGNLQLLANDLEVKNSQGNTFFQTHSDGETTFSAGTSEILKLLVGNDSAVRADTNIRINSLNGKFQTGGVAVADSGNGAEYCFEMFGSTNSSGTDHHGNVKVKGGGDLKLTTDSSSKTQVTAGKFQLASGTGINEFSTDTGLAGNSDDAVPTEKAVKTYVDASVPTSVANATTAANVTLVAENTSSDQHRIIFADSQTGSQTLQTDTSLVYQPSTGNLSLGSGGTASMGNLTLNSGTINSVQTIKGDSTLTIDPAPDDTGEVGGSTTDTGTVVILGDLRVTGETFTVNSTTVSVGDNEIVLNGDHTGTPTLDAGLRVERGSLNDAFFNWDESEDSWVVGEGQSSSPYFYTLLHSNNFETAYTGNIDGGSF
jgi:hypothetical protein